MGGSYSEQNYRSHSGYTAVISGASRPLPTLLRASVSLGSAMDGVGFIDPNLIGGRDDAHVQMDPVMNVIAVTSGARPCVDCGLMTGNWCETFFWGKVWHSAGGVCLAEHWIPSEDWGDGQRTPFCTSCEDKFTACHFCRQVASCTPFTHNRRPGETPPLVPVDFAGVRLNQHSGPVRR